MTREPHWDYMSRRLREEDMKESLHSVLSESQKEGICMMIGFTMFAIIPSLLWLFLPLWFQTSMVVQQNELHVNYNVTLLSLSLVASFNFLKSAYSLTGIAFAFFFIDALYKIFIFILSSLSLVIIHVL